MQETLLEELSTTARVRLNGRIAVALEQLWGDQAEERASRLALYFMESSTLAGHSEKAAHYTAAAGATAEAAFGWAEALRYFEACPGDRVLATLGSGAFATRVTAPETGVWRMPGAMSFEDGAAFGLVYVTAYTSLIVNSDAKAGETVLITGASGGVGVAMTQFGAARGMRIIAGVTSAEKAKLALENGAWASVDLAADNLRDSLRDQVHALTGGDGVDLAVDVVGGDVFDAAIRTLRGGGRIAIVGFASGRIPVIKANYLLVKRLTAIGSPLIPGRDGGDAVKDEAMTELFRLYEAGGLRPVISARIAFDDWREGFLRFRERRVTGKIVMVP